MLKKQDEFDFNLTMGSIKGFRTGEGHAQSPVSERVTYSGEWC